MLSRRHFLATAAAGTTAAAWGLTVPSSLAFALEPPRAPQPGGPILLNNNENAYGPFPSALKAAQESLSVAMRYPDRAADALIEQIATLHKVRPEQVMLGTGSTEILRAAAEAFTGPGRKLITAAPTFEALGVYSERRGAPVVKVPLRSDYAHDLEAMAARADASTGLIYLCNPNNPTASLTPRAEIEAFLPKLPRQTIVLIDEAYHHFTIGAPGYRSFLDAPVADDRVVVARTFSKIYGMAGLRLGYGVAAPQVAERLRRCQAWDNVNVVALLAGAASLSDTVATSAAAARNARDRQAFLAQAAARKLAAIPSFANFVMLDSGRPVRRVIGHFKSAGILIGRPFPPMDTCVRVSLGLPEEMRRFWEVWDTLPRA
jgi:histidinol-phosphate aminotransferase